MSNVRGLITPTPKAVAAVVVTFHPDYAVAERLKLLGSQVQHVVVVDNGSSSQELANIRAAAHELGLQLLENGENLGIASALNRGVRYALESGCRWIFLFDQDSQITEEFADRMLRSFAMSAWGERLGILVPTYRDVRLGLPIPSIRVAQGIEAAMTSGSLIPARVFEQHGMFRDELFIDAVDYEFSLRLRKAGMVLDETPEATLLHAPGAPVLHRLGDRVVFRTANYSPARRYYQERNKIWVARRYALAFPLFCAKLAMFSIKDFVKIILAEQNKRVKLRFFLRGIMDGLRGRMGRLPEG